MTNKIFVDSREPENIQKKALKLFGESTEVIALPVGDFVSGDICVERKTLPDLIQSTRSGHLHKQLIQMEQYAFPYLIVVGSFRDLHFTNIKGWTIEHHLGLFSSISARSRVKILQVDNDTQMLNLIKKLVEKHSDGKSYEITHTELLKNTISSDDMNIKVLTCYPRIGIKRAKKLLAEKPELVELLFEVHKVMEWKPADDQPT